MRKLLFPMIVGALLVFGGVSAAAEPLSVNPPSITIFAQSGAGEATCYQHAGDCFFTIYNPNMNAVNARIFVSDDNFVDTLEKSGDIVLVDNCQYLFSRKIGGFEKLDIFLNTVASSSRKSA